MKMIHVCRYFFTVALFIGMTVPSPVSAHEDHTSESKKLFTKHFDRSLFVITSGGHFSVEILLDDSEYPIGRDVIGVVIHNDRDEDVAGADIGFTVQNGEKVVPETGIADKNNGLYIVSGLDLRKEHTFSLSLSVMKNDVKDTAQFTFPESLNNLNPKGTYSP